MNKSLKMKTLLVLTLATLSFYSLHAQDAKTHFNDGLAKIESGDYRGAIADFDQGIQLDPNDAEAYTNRAFAKAMLEDYAGAMADYNRGIALDSNDADAYAN